MDPLNLILLIIVVFVGWRLWSVLGTRNDGETPSSRADAYRLNRDAYENQPEKPAKQTPPPALDQDAAPEEEAVESAASARAPHSGEQNEEQSDKQTEKQSEELDDLPAGRGLAYLHEIDPSFDDGGFLDGAARAYELILTAFAAGDLSDVSGFLGDDVAAGFEDAVKARQAAGQKLETRILRLDRPVLDDAEVDGTTARLDVLFRAEIISASYGADTELDEDNLPAPTTSIDIWSFEGQHSSATPDWKLVATRTG